MRTKSFLILLCMLISSFGQILAYTVGNGQSTEGTDFWVTFMQADQHTSSSGDWDGSYNTLTLSLSISAREDCEVTISNPFTGYSEKVNVTANQMQLVEVYKGSPLKSDARDAMNESGHVCYAVYSEQADTCALHVTSTKNISLIATNYKKATFDATNVLPTVVLGDEYYVQTYTPSDHDGVSASQGSHFCVIAAEDNTIIDYCPSEPTELIEEAKSKFAFSGGVGMTEEELRLANYEYGKDTLHSPVLMKGQVYYVWTGKKDKDPGDLSGTYVRAQGGKKIAVFQGCPHTNIPYQIKQRDHLFSQAIPVQYWGSNFVLTASANRPSDIVRVMAIHDGTEVRINGDLVHIFDFTQDTKRYWEFEIGESGRYAKDGSCVLSTSCPCTVHLFMTSQVYHGDKNSVGDPSMLCIYPIELQIDQVSFATYKSRNGTTYNYANVVTDRPDLMLLGDTSIASEFSPVSGSNMYYFARVSLGDTAILHTLRSNGSKFNAHVYGFTKNESYGYSVGGSFYTSGYNVELNYDKTKGTVYAQIYNYASPMCFGMNGLTAILHAEPLEGNGFLQWSDGNTDNPRRVELTQDTTFTAIFAKVHTITYKIDGEGYGGVHGRTNAYHGEKIEIKAVPSRYGAHPYDTPYRFIQWSDGITDNPRQVVITQDTTFTAIFGIARSGRCGDDWALTWSYDPNSKALTISGNGALNSNYTFGIEAPDHMEKMVFAEGVTAVGGWSFGNQTTLQEISFPTTMKTVGEYAFYNCTGLTHIYNYRERPCVAYSNTFDGIDKFDCTLHVLSASVDMYKAATAWRDFYYIQTIDAVETTTSSQEVTVEPTDNTATMTWPTSINTATYTIQITKDGVVFCTLIFNANGQLTGIAFAPSRNGSRNTPAAIMTTNGMQFTVTGLDSGTSYAYNLTAKDAQDAVIASYFGAFKTTGAATAIDQISSEEPIVNKVMINGQIFILRGDKTYTITGAEVK